MNVTEQIEIMKYEARLANRAKGDGIRNWTPEARAASLAKRRAEGSVWGWNHRTRATPKTYTTEAFDSSMDALNEDSEAVRQSLAIQAGGGKVLSARHAAYDDIAAQRLESFKAWLDEVKRVEGAIDDFNGTVAAFGGLTSGAGMAKRGKVIGGVSSDAIGKSIRRKGEKNDKVLDAEFRAALKYDREAKKADDVLLQKDHQERLLQDKEAAASEVSRKLSVYDLAEVFPYRTPLEKSIRRQFEKNGGAYARKDPDGNRAMMDMVAEKAEYYSASPAKKVEMEKNAYRQIRDSGSTTIRETPAAKGADYKTLLEAKRSYVRERDAVLPQLQADEVAYPAGNGRWIAQMPDGTERIIDASPAPFVLRLKKPDPPKGDKGKYVPNDDLMEAILEARLGPRRGSGLIVNRAHSAKCAASQSAGSECTCSCGGSQHGTNSTGTKITAVTDDGKRKSAGGTRADGTAFFASIGEDIGDGTTVVSVDVAGEKIRVRDKDGNEYDLAMNGQGRTGEKDSAATGYENNADLTEEEKARNKITLAFGEVMKDAIDDNEGIQDAMDVYDNEGAIGMSQDERMTVLEAMANNGKPSPELQRLQAELEAASDVFKQVKGELADLAKTQPVTLQDCLDQLKIDGDKDLYKIKVDALGEIYDQATREAFGDRAADSVTQEEWTAMQDKLGIPKEMQSDHNPDSGIENRWSDAARAAALIARRAKAAARKSALGVAGPTGEAGVKGEPGTGKSMADYKKLGLAGMDSDWAGKAVERLEEKEKWGKKLTADEARLVKQYNAQSAQEEKDRSSGKIPAAKLLESGYMTAQGPVVTYKAKDSSVKSGLSTDQGSSEDSSNWDKTVSGFKDLIEKGAKLTSANLQNQLLKDHDQKKYKLAKEALGEAWHTTSLDKFQDKFGRDPANNLEFRTFQKSIGVPPEFIGAK